MFDSIGRLIKKFHRAPVIEPEPIPSIQLRPELHVCPHCGAGLSTLALLHGGIIGKRFKGVVKASIRCRSCGRTHAIKGRTAYHRGVVLKLIDQPRKNASDRNTLYRNANLV